MRPSPRRLQTGQVNKFVHLSAPKRRIRAMDLPSPDASGRVQSAESPQNVPRRPPDADSRQREIRGILRFSHRTNDPQPRRYSHQLPPKRPCAAVPPEIELSGARLDPEGTDRTAPLWDGHACGCARDANGRQSEPTLESPANRDRGFPADRYGCRWNSRAKPTAFAQRLFAVVEVHRAATADDQDSVDRQRDCRHHRSEERCPHEDVSKHGLILVCAWRDPRFRGDTGGLSSAFNEHRTAKARILAVRFSGCPASTSL